MEILSYSHFSPDLSTMIIAEKQACNQFFLIFPRFSSQLSTDADLSTEGISTPAVLRKIFIMIVMISDRMMI